MKKNTRGEIATILTLSTLIIIGLSSLASSFFLKNRNVVKSKAEGPTCACNQIIGSVNYHRVGADCDGAIEYTESTCTTRVGPTPTSSPSISSSGKCECGSDGKVVSPDLCGDTNPCGPVPNKDNSAPNGNPSCSAYGDWSNVCAGTNENCPADAGVTYTYWCDGKSWRFQYPNCVTWCKKEYIEKPPPSANIDALCKDGTKQKSAGTIVTTEYKTSGRALPKPQVEEIGGQLVACDGNQGVYVEMNAFCDQFGQVQWGPGAKTNKTCLPPDINITRTPSGKFWLTADVEVKKSGNKINFETTVTFNSSDCDGDITLYKNGGLQAGPNRWRRPNNFSGGTFIFEYYPQWTGTTTLESGGKETASYRGRLDNCPRSDVPLEDSVSCEFGVSPYGIPWVRGAGCNLKNFSDIQKITPAMTPVVKKQPTWAPPPPPKLNTTPIIFRPGTPFATPTVASTGRRDGTKGATCGIPGYADCIHPLICDRSYGRGLGGLCADRTPTAAPPGAATPAPGAATPGTLRCTHPNSRQVLTCPDWQALNLETWENIVCNPSGKESDSCFVTCFNRDRSKTVECYPGDPNAQGDVFNKNRNIYIVNFSKKTIIVNKIYITRTAFGLENTRNTFTKNINKKLVSNDQMSLFYEDLLCIAMVGIGRNITIDISYEGEARRSTMKKNSGCTEDTVFIITD